MKKILLVIFIFTTSLCVAQKKQPKTVQQQVKEYITWFKTLSDTEKRSASRGLVDKLNSMDPKTKGMWLAALESQNPQKKIEEKKIVYTPMTSEQIDAELIKKTTDLISSDEESEYFKFNPKYSKLESIKIKNKVSNKDRAEKYNAKLQAEMDSISSKLVKLKEERTKLKSEIPEGYKPQYDDDLEYDNQGNKINDPIKPKYKAFNSLTNSIQHNTHVLADYPEKILKGIMDYTNWEDTTKNRFLIEVTILPLDGLDDSKPIIYSYIGFYNATNGETSDSVEVAEPENEKPIEIYNIEGY